VTPPIGSGIRRRKMAYATGDPRPRNGLAARPDNASERPKDVARRWNRPTFAAGNSDQVGPSVSSHGSRLEYPNDLCFPFRGVFDVARGLPTKLPSLPFVTMQFPDSLRHPTSSSLSLQTRESTGVTRRPFTLSLARFFGDSRKLFTGHVTQVIASFFTPHSPAQIRQLAGNAGPSG